MKISYHLLLFNMTLLTTTPLLATDQQNPSPFIPSHQSIHPLKHHRKMTKAYHLFQHIPTTLSPPHSQALKGRALRSSPSSGSVKMFYPEADHDNTNILFWYDNHRDIVTNAGRLNLPNSTIIDALASQGTFEYQYNPFIPITVVAAIKHINHPRVSFGYKEPFNITTEGVISILDLHPETISILYGTVSNSIEADKIINHKNFNDVKSWKFKWVSNLQALLKITEIADKTDKISTISTDMTDQFPLNFQNTHRLQVFKSESVSSKPTYDYLIQAISNKPLRKVKVAAYSDGNAPTLTDISQFMGATPERLEEISGIAVDKYQNDDPGIKLFTDKLLKATQLTTFDFGGKLTHDMWQALANLPCLTDFSYGNETMSPDEVKDLAHLLERQKYLRYLNLTFNGDDESWQVLGKSLAKATTIEELSLNQSNPQKTINTTLYLEEFFKNNQALQSFNVELLNDASLETMCLNLKTNQLQILGTSQLDLGPKGLSLLTDFLAKQNNLVQFYVNGITSIKNEDMVAIIASIHSKNVASIDIVAQDNSLTQDFQNTIIQQMKDQQLFTQQARLTISAPFMKQSSITYVYNSQNPFVRVQFFLGLGSGGTEQEIDVAPVSQQNSYSLAASHTAPSSSSCLVS